MFLVKTKRLCVARRDCMSLCSLKGKCAHNQFLASIAQRIGRKGREYRSTLESEGPRGDNRSA